MRNKNKGNRTTFLLCGGILKIYLHSKSSTTVINSPNRKDKNSVEVIDKL